MDSPDTLMTSHCDGSRACRRAYAQYIAWPSGSSVLKAQLDKMLTHKDRVLG